MKSTRLIWDTVTGTVAAEPPARDGVTVTSTQTDYALRRAGLRIVSRESVRRGARRRQAANW
jgi:hypothetical protein